jgi:hypothetical protein
MRWFLSLSVLVVLLPSPTLGAEAPDKPSSFQQDPYNLQNSAITPTPEMWFYLQEVRRQDDPQMAVRRNAEFRAAQRRSRLASMKWFGMSNQRPRANPTPWFGVYSPAWVAGLWEPDRWIGGHSVVLYLTDRVVSEASQ